MLKCIAQLCHLIGFHCLGGPGYSKCTVYTTKTQKEMKEIAKTITKLHIIFVHSFATLH